MILVWGVIVLGGGEICQGGNCPVVIIWKVFVQGVFVQGGIVQGHLSGEGICPRTIIMMHTDLFWVDASFWKMC